MLQMLFKKGEVMGKRTIEIAASFTGTISTGSYENEKPYFAVKETIEILHDDPMTVWETSSKDEMIEKRQQELHSICYNQFRRQEEAVNIERIQKEYQNIRFYDTYPSVTSIIGWDKDFHISQDELSQHASRGTIIDKQVEIYLNTGEWKEPKDISEIYPDLVIVRNGTLNLELDNVNFIAFFEKYPFKIISQQTKVKNDEHKYAGRMEIKCIIENSNKGEWAKIKGCLFDIPTLLDLKCTSSLDKTYVMKQNTAYANCDEEIKQIGAIHLKKDNVCGYAKPIIETDLDKYWSLFLRDRENFTKRYGV